MAADMEITTDLARADNRATPRSSPANSRVILKLDQVSKSFATKHHGETLHALSQVSLDIYEGEFVALLGPSGCGKTTLLRIIKGLETPDSGSVTFDSSGSARSGIGFVFQSPSLLPWLNVKENISFGLTLFAGRSVLREDSLEARVRQLLTLVGLSDFGDFYPRQLSGGMRQRVNMARALAIDPALLLMDEPFGALDALTKEHLQRELGELAVKLNTTTIFVTHDIREAVFLADRLVVMYPRPGRIAEVVSINLPRPRDSAFQHGLDLAERAQYVWQLLKDFEAATE